MAGSLGRRALAELIGTAPLVTAVDVGLELFENAVAAGAAPDPARRLAPSRPGG